MRICLNTLATESRVWTSTHGETLSALRFDATREMRVGEQSATTGLQLTELPADVPAGFMQTLQRSTTLHRPAALATFQPLFIAMAATLRAGSSPPREQAARLHRLLMAHPCAATLLCFFLTGRPPF